MAVGKIGPFELDKDSWDYYIDRLEQSFIANAVDDKVKVATLITVIGSEAYSLMANLCMPVKPSTKTFKDLVTIMKEHLQPRPSLLAERFKFRQRVQSSDESVGEYATVLKKLSKDCKFEGDSLQENLRDQFVCGLTRDSIRQRLFTEDNIKFERAFKIAVAMEMAEADAALMEQRAINRGDGLGTSGEMTTPLHQIRSSGRGRAGGRAPYEGSSRGSAHANTAGRGAGTNAVSGAGSGGGWRTRHPGIGEFTKGFCRACGGQHAAESCKFKMYVCRVCNKEGHLKRVCPRMKGGSATAVNNMENKISGVDSSSDSDEVNNFAIDSERLKLFKPYTIDVCVNGKCLRMEMDTGSSVSCINFECYKRLFTDLEILDCDLSLRYYTGELVVPVGKITPLVTYEDRSKYLDLYIVNSGKTSLLGRQWLGELGIKVPFVHCNNVKGEAFNLDMFSSSYRDVFGEGLGRFTGGKVGFHLRPDARPVFLRARPLAYALREPVEHALDQLVRDGVLEPVHTSDWATPIVPVMKKDGTIRDEPASSGDSGDESGSDPESPSDKLNQATLRQDWICNSSTEREGGSREPQASTSSTTQEADSSKASQQSMPKILPKLDLPGRAMLYPGVLGLDGLGSNLSLGNLAMGYPHSFILGLANQGQDGASSSNQPQFITIPLSMAMGNPQAPNGCPSASSDDSSELQDLSTGGRK